MYIFKLFKEIRIWYVIRKVAYENVALIEKEGFRVDWVGRIYTVINLPDEIATAQMDPKVYVMMQLQKFNPLFLKLGISDYVAPEMVEIPNTFAYLLVISPNREYFTIPKLFFFGIRLCIFYVIAKLLFALMLSEKSIEFFNMLYQYL